MRWKIDLKKCQQKNQPFPSFAKGWLTQNGHHMEDALNASLWQLAPYSKLALDAAYHANQIILFWIIAKQVNSGMVKNPTIHLVNTGTW